MRLRSPEILVQIRMERADLDANSHGDCELEIRSRFRARDPQLSSPQARSSQLSRSGVLRLPLRFIVKIASS